ncbi:hypothetical protein [Synechococcus sp. CC9616]|uniref:hypothetical protein n=1 Tax=Synechococcus sp. CC9616 TaxID=110663 RepID=UPI000490D02B|nr:hypothetical protein [Synechococcus sp. CC9616]
MADRILLSHQGFAKWVMATIQEPAETSDGGDQAKANARMMLFLAGSTEQEVNQLMNDWLDGRPGAEAALETALTNGARVMFPNGNARKN